ncbi:uncharacterized protein LAESUDRAFT_67572 [Laetiporus sulphureus 93-53]|uniref:Uncharacterized protein n=1 Tax=Laetiporus sulphureus 93-53 TaxID=1314785 RepID=A0A165F5V0_9APHY|nr:uncharacterized protein LAESUDRAFT_67572 [Laetiporus sulphureus 93-53]KZT08448.1 hypothetical protein LAESUDRAFT_67572 [Laetiporus sulphureus 93-53]
MDGALYRCSDRALGEGQKHTHPCNPRLSVLYPSFPFPDQNVHTEGLISGVDIQHLREVARVQASHQGTGSPHTMDLRVQHRVACTSYPEYASPWDTPPLVPSISRATSVGWVAERDPDYDVRHTNESDAPGAEKQWLLSRGGDEHRTMRLELRAEI